MFHTGRERSTTIGRLAPGVCSVCGERGWYALVRTRPWLTLFWVLPLLPTGRATEYVVCESCHTARELPKDLREEAHELQSATDDWIHGSVDSAAYVDRVDAFQDTWNDTFDHLPVEDTAPESRYIQ